MEGFGLLLIAQPYANVGVEGANEVAQQNKFLLYIVYRLVKRINMWLQIVYSKWAQYPEQSKISPVRLTNCPPSSCARCVQAVFSPPSPRQKEK